jgi:hypothetical protein
MLLGHICMFSAFSMIALPVVFCCSAVCLGGVFVMLGCFVVFVSRHFRLLAVAPDMQDLDPGFVPLTSGGKRWRIDGK